MLRRNAIGTLALGLVLAIVALSGLSSPASAAPKPVTNTQPAIVPVAYVTGNVPVSDCNTMVSGMPGM